VTGTRLGGGREAERGALPTPGFSNPEGYERVMGRWSRNLAPLFIGFAGVEDGERVLDVGAGTGNLSLAVAERFPSCETVGVDPVAEFVEFANARAPGARARFEQGDAQALRFAAASFDRALAMLVLGFVPDREKAAAEMRRVTRPGGTAAACGWDFSGGMEMARHFWEAALQVAPEAEPEHPRYLPLAGAGQHAALWRRAGFADVREEAIELDLEFAGFEDLWRPYLEGATPTSRWLLALGPERIEAVAERLKVGLLGERPDRPFTLRARAWAVRGERRT
jgi:SAM-dependent methyltransferase